MSADIYLTEYDREGVDLRAYPDGLYIGGWYDSMVGIEGGLVTWEQIEELRRKARRRKPFNREAR